MQRINPVTQPEGKAKELLDSVKQMMGATPNLFTTFANAPAALEAYLGMISALGHGVLAAKLREQLAVTVAAYNGCNYCASAHVFLGGKAGVGRDELVANSKGHSSDSKTQTALTFARALLEKRGNVCDDTFAAIRAAGFSDGEIVEIIAHVAMNTFTNFFNNAAKTEIDFPLFDINAA